MPTQLAKRKILVTNALPYANGPLHLGHMVGFMQADIWARFQKLRGHQVTFVGGDDQHGTPIMLGAEKQGITPKQLIDDICLLYTSPSPRDQRGSRMPSSA